jgi:hypothetical protein
MNFTSLPILTTKLAATLSGAISARSISSRRKQAVDEPIAVAAVESNAHNLSRSEAVETIGGRALEWSRPALFMGTFVLFVILIIK